MVSGNNDYSFMALHYTKHNYLHTVVIHNDEKIIQSIIYIIW